MVQACWAYYLSSYVDSRVVETVGILGVSSGFNS